MSCREESAATLREAGHRVTSAKLLVLEALRHAADHLSATSVIEEVRRESPHVSESTVYRTLSSLRDSNLISETTFGRGEVAYEWLGERPHHHLVCGDCGAVFDLDGELVEEFSARIRQGTGFAPDLRHLAVTGRCAACAEGGRG